jgi:hypothetical protein
MASPRRGTKALYVRSGWTDGHQAAAVDDHAALSAWLTTPERVHAIDELGYGIGHIAIQEKATRCLKIWLQRGGDPTFPDPRGDDVMQKLFTHTWMEQPCRITISMLIEHGYGPSITKRHHPEVQDMVQHSRISTSCWQVLRSAYDIANSIHTGNGALVHPQMDASFRWSSRWRDEHAYRLGHRLLMGCGTGSLPFINAWIDRLATGTPGRDRGRLAIRGASQDVVERWWKRVPSDPVERVLQAYLGLTWYDEHMDDHGRMPGMTNAHLSGWNHPDAAALAQRIITILPDPIEMAIWASWMDPSHR